MTSSRTTQYLCSFHIPKTGGTTFAHHARISLPGDEFLLHGPFARAERFMKNQPQVEEMNDEALNKLRVVHGHGAGLDLAKAIKGRMPEFLVILRDPYERFVSGFNHYNKERHNSALPPVSEDDYLDSRGGNFYSKTLLSHFKPVAGGGKRLTINNLLPILQSFKYLLLTEHMDQQLHELSALYGLGKNEIETRRANKSKIETAIDREAFGKLNEVDLLIYKELEAVAATDSVLQNPFGYRPQALEEYLKQAWIDQTSADRLGAAYVDLVEALKKSLKLQAAQLKLVHGCQQHVHDSQALLGMVENEIGTWLTELTSDEKSMAYFWSGVMFMNDGDTQHAEEYFFESIKLNPVNDNSLARLAEVLFGRGAKEEAKRYIGAAISLRPDRQVNQKIYQAILRKT